MRRTTMMVGPILALAVAARLCGVTRGIVDTAQLAMALGLVALLGWFVWQATRAERG